MPILRGPTSRTACGAPPADHEPTAASAAGCPRVRAPCIPTPFRRARWSWSRSCASSSAWAPGPWPHRPRRPSTCSSTDASGQPPGVVRAVVPASRRCRVGGRGGCRLAGRATLRCGGLPGRVGRRGRRGCGRLARGSALGCGRLGGLGSRGTGSDRVQRRVGCTEDGVADGRTGSVTGPGFWLTCARSTASSSGGTSLHGSFDDVGRGAASRGRSSRRP